MNRALPNDPHFNVISFDENVSIDFFSFIGQVDNEKHLKRAIRIFLLGILPSAENVSLVLNQISRSFNDDELMISYSRGSDRKKKSFASKTNKSES
jgi:hypothetical protein